jgi:hypothetical protein
MDENFTQYLNELLTATKNETTDLNKKNRNKKSSLESWKKIIADKRNLGWSFNRISEYLYKAKLTPKKVNRSTILRFCIKENLPN